MDDMLPLPLIKINLEWGYHYVVPVTIKIYDAVIEGHVVVDTGATTCMIDDGYLNLLDIQTDIINALGVANLEVKYLDGVVEFNSSIPSISGLKSVSIPSKICIGDLSHVWNVYREMGVEIIPIGLIGTSVLSNAVIDLEHEIIHIK